MRDPTTEEIMAKVPDLIEKSEIDLTKRSNSRPTGKANANGWRSEKDRIRAVTVYAVTGNAAQTAEITGIPSGTIRQWKTHEWWPRIMDRIRQEKDDELDVKFTEIVDKTVKQINDRIEKGDFIYNTRTGEITRVPMDGKDLGVVTSIFVDKRELLRGKRKFHTDQESIKDKLDAIAKMLKGNKENEKVIIDGEFVEEIEDASASEEQEQERSREDSEVLANA